MVDLDFNYKAELPRRTVMQRLMEGRRPIAIVLMSLSVFGSVVPMLRKSIWFKVLLPVLFACGIIYAVRSSRNEDESARRRSSSRMREMLAGEIRRIVSEVQREKLSRVSAHLNDRAREGLRQLDAAAREELETRAAKAEGERSEARTRGKYLEQRGKAAQAMAARVAKFQQACAEVEVAARAQSGARSAGRRLYPNSIIDRWAFSTL